MTSLDEARAFIREGHCRIVRLDFATAQWRDGILNSLPKSPVEGLMESDPWLFFLGLLCFV